MHRIADTYGPIVYSKFGKNEANSVDTQEEAYKAFFNDLDKAVEALDAYLKEGGKEDGVKVSICPIARLPAGGLNLQIHCAFVWPCVYLM